MDKAFTKDVAAFEEVIERWHTFSVPFVRRSFRTDWQWRVPQEFVESMPVVAERNGYATVLDLQSRSARRFLNVVQFEPRLSQPSEPSTAAWLEKFGDPHAPVDQVDLLRIHYFGDSHCLSALWNLFEEFVVAEASAVRVEEVIRALGFHPTAK